MVNTQVNALGMLKSATNQQANVITKMTEVADACSDASKVSSKLIWNPRGHPDNLYDHAVYINYINSFIIIIKVFSASYSKT